MKTFNELYSQWELIQRIYHENNDRETAYELMSELNMMYLETGSKNWAVFCELAETMDCGNSIPVLRDVHSSIGVHEYSKLFDCLKITEFAYAEESTAALPNMAEFLELGWRIEGTADVRACKWDEKTRKVIKFIR